MPGRPVTLKKVAITGGPVLDLSGVDGPSRGATWGEDDTIILATASLSTGLQRVSSAGGKPTVLRTPKGERGERVNSGRSSYRAVRLCFSPSPLRRRHRRFAGSSP